MMKNKIIILIILGLMFFQNMAVSAAPEGPYVEDSDTLEITKAGVSTYVFNPGDTVDIRITTNRVISGSGTLRLINYKGTEVTPAINLSGSGPVYKGSIVIPASQSEYVYVDAYVSQGGNKFSAKQMLELGASPSQYVKLYKSDCTTESYSFNANEVMCVKAFGDTGNPAGLTVKENSFNLTSQSFTTSNESYANGYYTFNVNLSGLTYTDQWWYFLSVFQKQGKKTLVDASKMFLIDVDPVARITTPISSPPTLTGSVNIVGTASDANLDYYKIEYEDSDNPGIWNQVGSNMTSPVTNGTLLTWDTTQVPNGKKYALKLTVYDKSGRSSEHIVASGASERLDINNGTGSFSLNFNVADLEWIGVGPLLDPDNTGKGLTVNVDATGQSWNVTLYSVSGDSESGTLGNDPSGKLYTEEIAPRDTYKGTFRWLVDTATSTVGPIYTYTSASTSGTGTDFASGSAADPAKEVAAGGSGNYSIEVDYLLGNPTWDTTPANYTSTHYYTYTKNL